MNSYWDATFFEFFLILGKRICLFCMGHDLVLESDELQLGVLAAVACSCGLIGPFLVLKRMAMFANSLSHTVLLGIVTAFLIASKFWGGEMFSLSTLILGSFAAALLTALLTEGLIRVFHLQEDASVGFVFSTLFALGVLLVTLFPRDVHLGTEAIMGNADALQPRDFRFAAWLALQNFAIVFFLYRKLQIASFDRSYASTLGIPSGVFHFLLLCLASTVCVSAFRAVGVLLVLAFLTGPYLTARQFTHRLSLLLCWSALFGVLASCIAVALSRHILSLYGFPLSTGGIAVCVIGLFYGLSLFFKAFFYDKIRRPTGQTNLFT